MDSLLSFKTFLPLIIAAVIVVGLFGLNKRGRKRGGYRRRAYQKRRKLAQQKYRPIVKEQPTTAVATNTKEEQTERVIKRIANTQFYANPLLNRYEKIVFLELMRALEPYNYEYRVFPQVSFGEVINCRDFAARSSINSKRLDFLITDRQFTPLIAIEYNGEGHFKGDYAKRDTIKEIAIQKAGLHFVAIHYAHNERLADFIEKNILSLLPISTPNLSSIAPSP